jgi:hypothetical protein
MTLALALVAVLHATPTWSISVTRRVGVDPAKAAELSLQFAEKLTGLGEAIDPKTFADRLSSMGLEPGTCAGSADCIANLGKRGGVDRVVALQLLKLGTKVTVDATLFDVATGSALGAVTDTVPMASPQKKLAELAAKLSQKAPPLPPPEPVAAVEPPPPAPPPAPPPSAPPAQDAPKAEVLTPAPSPQPVPMVAAEHKTPALRYVSFGLGGAAIVSLGVAITMSIVSVYQANSIPNTDPQFLQAHQIALNTARGADVSYGVAGAFAVSSIVAFLLSR